MLSLKYIFLGRSYYSLYLLGTRITYMETDLQTLETKTKLLYFTVDVSFTNIFDLLVFKITQDSDFYFICIMTINEITKKPILKVYWGLGIFIIFLSSQNYPEFCDLGSRT